MSGKWDCPEVPKHGWVCVGIEDLGEPSDTCAMCEVMTIRYVHAMRHPDYPGELGCGCICAGQMEDSLSAAKGRERMMHNRASRKQRWLTRRWQRSRNGHAYLKTGPYLVVVYPIGDIWGFRITQTATCVSFSSRKPLDNEAAAKLRAFDAMWWLHDRDWVIPASVAERGANSVQPPTCSRDRLR